MLCQNSEKYKQKEVTNSGSHLESVIRSEIFIFYIVYLMILLWTKLCTPKYMLKP